MSKDRIIAGEPVNLRFDFENICNETIYLNIYDDYNLWDDNKANRLDTESLKIDVYDEAGNEVLRRDLPCRPHSQFDLIPMTQDKVQPGGTPQSNWGFGGTLPG